MSRADSLPGLTIVQGNRLERLADSLVEVLRAPIGSPLEPEHVVVPNWGMARWLSLRLADRLGICLNVRFQLPASFVWELWRRVLGDVPEEAEWTAGVLAWRVYAEIARASGRVFEPLQKAVQDADDLGRFELAQRLGEVFDQYLVYRGDLILGWESSTKRDLRAHADELWQAELWRRLMGPRPARHRAQLAREFAALAEAGTLPGPLLPRRLSIFAIPALAPLYLDAFDALSRFVEVKIFLLNPCRQYWGDIVAEREIARRVRERDPAELYLESGNHLLASLGQQGRDFVEMVTERGAHTIDLFEEPSGASLLEQVQADILDLRCRGSAETEPAEIDAKDRSIRVQICHSAMREVEVLHDQLLDLFDRHPDLDPADVRVMTPDIEAYAPLIDAVFGTLLDERRIPYSIADRPPQAESPVVAAFLTLLEIATSRHDASKVLSLLEAPPVRRRFDIGDDDLAQINAWVRDAGIRWGIDAQSRAALDLPATHENTWRFGLDRLMLGYAMPGEGRETFHGILPCDDVEGVQTQIMGRLQSFAEILFQTSAALVEPRPPRQWQELLDSLLGDFFDLRTLDEGDVELVRSAIHGLAEDAARAGHVDPVPLAIVRAEIERRLTSLAAPAGFLSGAVTFCTMVPMRNVPAEVICLLGMNDGAYPRSHRAPSFDLMTRSFRRGDRSRSDDDRYLFLEALLAARRCFYVSYVGRGVRDNAPLPPSVLVSELEDALRTGFRRADGGDVVDQVTTVHPLQPFSPRYFTPGSSLFSFARELCQATARGGKPAPRQSDPPRPFLAHDLPAADDEWRTVSLDRLLRFFNHPQRFLLRERLGLILGQAEALIDSQEPFQVANLERYKMRESLLDLWLSGVPAGATLELLRAQGILPHGRVGSALLDTMLPEIERFAARLAAATQERPGPPQTIDLAIADFRLVGALGGITSTGIVRHRLGENDARWRLSLWIQHLVLHAHTRSRNDLRSVLVADDETVSLRPVGDAERYLTELLGLYWRGIHSPLAFSPRVSDALLRRRDAKPGKERPLWPGADRNRGENADAWVRLAFRGQKLSAAAFETLAHLILDPLYEHEVRS